MQKTLMLASAAFALALTSLSPVLAQDAPPPPPVAGGPAAAGPDGAPPPRGPHPAPRFKGAEIKLDFGAGRKVAIECGAASLQDCITAATPLIDKVAATEPVRGPGGHDRDKPRGPGKDKPKD